VNRVRTGMSMVAASVLVLTGCGGSSPESAVDLLDRLTPGRTASAVVVDLRAAGEKLGVTGLDPRTAFASRNPGERRLAALFGAGFPLLAQPTSIPAVDAIDLTRVTAVANNGPAGRGLVVVLATDQPFAEVAGKLQAAGYTRDGDLLVKPNPARTAAASAVGGGSGVIVIGSDREGVRAAVEDRAEGIEGLALDVLTNVDAPAAAVLAPGEGCPHAIAIADDIDEGRGRLVVVTPDARPDRVTANQPGNVSFKNRTFEPPTVDDDRVTVPFRYPTDATGHTPLLTLGELIPKDVYDCAR
jgi:hypothetical protein